MIDDPPSTPTLTPAAAKAKVARDARQAAALRANLRRRKDQARGRDAQDQPTLTEPAHGLYPNISE